MQDMIENMNVSFVIFKTIQHVMSQVSSGMAVATDALVLQHQGISSNSAVYAPMTFQLLLVQSFTGLILGLCSANERRPYFVTMSLISWVQS